jgi:hypothetical protein
MERHARSFVVAVVVVAVVVVVTGLTGCPAKSSGAAPPPGDDVAAFCARSLQRMQECYPAATHTEGDTAKCIAGHHALRLAGTFSEAECARFAACLEKPCAEVAPCMDAAPAP